MRGMDAVGLSPGWVFGVGAVGGVINAALTDNLRLWPVRVSSGSARQIGRVGLVINVITAGTGALVVIAALALQGCSVDVRTLGTGTLVAALIGFLSARCVTDHVDKRLLREAACRACAAPAAHPDTIRAIRHATPYAVLAAADELIPRRVS
jgi:hypothetical protein